MTSGERFVEGLRREHVDVTLVSSDARDGEGVRLPGFVLPVHAMRSMKFVMARPERAAIAKAIAEADVVHLQFPFWLSFAALAEARRANKPVVAAFHVQPENMFFNIGLRARFLQDGAYRLWIRHFYGRADVVVCPSAFAEAKLREHGLEVPTRVLTNGVPADVSPDGPRDRDPGHEDAFLITTAGRLAKEKRQDLVIEAVRRSRNAARIQLVIAGMGPLEDEYRALAKELPRPAVVGYLSRPDLLRTLRASDLFVHASEVELEGIAVLEALGSGVPALVADAPESAAKHLALGPELLFPPGDADALAAKIDALVESPSMLASARERALGVARAHDFQTSLAGLVSIYEELARR